MLGTGGDETMMTTPRCGNETYAPAGWPHGSAPGAQMVTTPRCGNETCAGGLASRLCPWRTDGDDAAMRQRDMRRRAGLGEPLFDS
jgi:hypothetical protein